MDPVGNWAQDVLRCHLCKTPGPPKYCDICDIYLCRPCVKEHLFDDSTEHKVVPFEMRGSTNLCLRHSLKICEQYCQQCNIPICMLCASSTEHKGHELVDILKAIESKKNVLERDLQELENCIYPKYQEIASNFTDQMANLKKHSKKLILAIDTHGEDLHREIDFAIQQLKSDLNEMDSKYLADLKSHEDEITCTLSSINQSIAKVRKLLNSNDVCLVSAAYRSRNTEYRTLPRTLIVTLPSFTPLEIRKKHIYQQLGTLTTISVKTDDHKYTMDAPDGESPPFDKPLINVPRIITEIKTEYEEYKLRSVSCLDDDNVWTCGADDFMMRLYNLQGELVKSTQTKSGNWPRDISVTSSKELVYADRKYTAINIKNIQIQIDVEIGLMRPLCVCCTSSGDLLIVFDIYASEQTKVGRFCGSALKQIIGYNNNGQPLYSYSEYVYNKFITENMNLDVCVSDNKAGAVVVVNQAGKFRFSYSGHPSGVKRSFSPLGISTDSQGRILTADFSNDCIHILNQDGQFLRFIDNCALSSPYGLCVDTSDNLFVAENGTGKVKKIQYSRIQKYLVDCNMYRPIELVILSNSTKL